MAADALLQLQSPTTVTATGTTAGLSIRKPASTTGVDRGGTPRRGLIVRVVVTSVSGTTPTMGLVLQVSDDNSTYQNRSFALPNSITAAGEYFIPFDTFKPWIRLQYTVGGTTPSFTFSAEIVNGRP